MTKWILASASPRRKELMSRMRVPFQVIPSNAEEVITESDPKEAVKRLAKGWNVTADEVLLSRLTNYLGESCVKVIEKPIESVH